MDYNVGSAGVVSSDHLSIQYSMEMQLRGWICAVEIIELFRHTFLIILK